MAQTTFWRCGAACSTALVLMLTLTPSPAQGPAQKEELPEPQTSAASTAPPVSAHGPVLTLAEARLLALEKQPALAAYRASLDAARAKHCALQNLRVPGFVRPDLPYRRQQAALGVRIAEAQLAQGEWDTLYAVTWSYLTALYALEQQQRADEGIRNLKDLQRTSLVLFHSKLKKPDPTLSQRQLKELENSLYERVEKGENVFEETELDVWLLLKRARLARDVVQARRREAEQGYARALAALREAVGWGPGPCFHLADRRLPEPRAILCLDDLIGQALARRGEVFQTALAAEVVALEVKAQQSLRGQQAPTFAAGSDLHAVAVAPGSKQADYRPGGVALEMPTMMVGSPDARAAQAAALHRRAVAVAEKARGLVALEVEDAYRRWLDSHQRAADLPALADRAEAISQEIQQAISKGATLPQFEILLTRIQGAQTDLQGIEARYQALVALAVLERATAANLAGCFDAP